MLTAKNIMTKNVVSVQKDAPVCEAIELMLKSRVAGMPVVRERYDPDGDYHGKRCAAAL